MGILLDRNSRAANREGTFVMKIRKRLMALLLVISSIVMICGGCGFESAGVSDADTVLGSGSSVLRIVSGSENGEGPI